MMRERGFILTSFLIIAQIKENCLGLQRNFCPRKRSYVFPTIQTKQFLSTMSLTFFAHKIEIIHSDIAGMEVSCVADVVLVDREAGPDKQLSAFKPLSESAS